jgi:hypothetical protein
MLAVAIVALLVAPVSSSSIVEFEALLLLEVLNSTWLSSVMFVISAYYSAMQSQLECVHLMQ